MLFFADTADTKALKHLNDMGLLDGVTTNPSLIAKTGKELAPLFEEILALIKGPVSLEVTAMDTEGMLKEAKHLSGLGSNVVIKLPLTLPGLAACRNLSEKGIKTNVTLCFSLQQALMAAKAGATFVSPFVGRLDDICQDGMELIEEIRMVYDNYDYETKILVASVRNLAHIRSSVLIGADAITCPPDMFESMAKHPLTDKGLEAFLSDWKKSGKKI